MHTGRTLCEGEGRDLKTKMPEIANKPPEAMEDSLPHLPPKEPTLLTLQSQTLTSKTAKQCISVISATQLGMLCLIAALAS